MNDVQRQQYLGAMGIATWFPQVVLPHALSSPQAALPEPLLEAITEDGLEVASSDSSIVEKVAIEQSPVSAGLSKISVDLSAPTPVKPQAIEPQAVTPDAAVVEVPKGETPKFKLCMTYFSSGHLLVDTLGSEGLTSAVQRFYQAFGLAIQHDNQQLQQSLFKWPLFNNRHIDQGEQIARTSCLQHIQQTLTERPETFVLLGEAASRYAASADAIVMVESVAEIMAKPELKAELAKKLGLI